MTESYVFDTYALMEIVMGNPVFLRYMESSKVVLNPFIFAEFCYGLLKRYPLEYKSFAAKVAGTVMPLEEEQIMQAMELRYANKKKEMSTTDCISYIQAQKLGIPFLTGDGAFKGMPGVEVVK